MEKVSDPARSPEERWTYGDYRRWPEDERWELIDGAAYLMGAPTVSHQRLVRRFLLALSAFLEGKECEVFLSPLDVLSFAPGEGEEDECSTVVQPDLFVLCDRAGLNDKNLHGLPELVVEVLSPSTSRKDQHEKFSLYERGGVKEYWVADPEGGWVCLYVRSAEGKLKEAALRERRGDRSPIASTCLQGFSLDFETLFEGPA